jgi:hypothetical protein
MIMQTVIQLFGPDSANEEKRLPRLMKRRGPGRFDQSLATPPEKASTSPYLLLLLANQELAEGREDQARCLVEAAYELFDQKAEGGAFKLYLAG